MKHRNRFAIILSLALVSCADGDEVDQVEEAIVERAEIPLDPAEQKRIEDMESARVQLLSDMELSLRPVRGRRGAAVKEVGRDLLVLAGSPEPMAQQSVSKLWVNLTIAEMVARGQMTYQDPVVVTNSDRAVFHQPLARRTASGNVNTTVGDLMSMAITRSDNMANQVLMDLAGGPGAVQSWLSRHDVGVAFGPGDRVMQTAISGLVWDPRYADRQAFEAARNSVPSRIRNERFSLYAANPVDGAGVVEMVRALDAMYTGEYPGSTDVVSLMSNTVTGRSRLKAGTPAGWTLMHKTGTGQTWGRRRAGFNDVGLLRSPEGRTYAVAVMIGDSDSGDRIMQEAIAGIAGAVVDYHERTQECCVRSM